MSSTEKLENASVEEVEAAELAANPWSVRALTRDKGLRNVLILSLGMTLAGGGASVIGVVAQLVIAGLKPYGFHGDEGYISFAITSIASVIGTALFPAIIRFTSVKTAFFLGGTSFALWTAAFVFPQPLFMYAMAFVFGFGVSIMATAATVIVAAYSTSEATSSRNFGVFFCMTSLAWIWGNLFVSIEFVNRTEINDSTRLHTFLPLLATSIAGVVVMTLVARPPVSKESEEARANESVWDGIKSSFVRPLTEIGSRPILLMMAMVLYTGLEASFFGSVYPTAVGFTLQLGKSAKSIAGLVGLAGAGFGGFLGGTISGPISTRLGRRYAVALGFILQWLGFAIALTNLPFDSSLHETSGSTLMYPNAILLVLGSLFLGIGDAFFCTQLLTLVHDCFSQGADADRRTSNAYAINSFLKSLSSAVLFFAATEVGLQYHVSALVIVGIVAAGLFLLADVEYRQGRYRQ